MVGIFPTDTVYGVGCGIKDREGEKRIYAMKKRPLAKALPILFSAIPEGVDWAESGKYVPELARRVWPGKVTLVVRYEGSLKRLLGGKRDWETVGIRVSDHWGVREAERIAGVGILSTSANISGRGNEKALGEMSGELKTAVDFIVDGGVLKESAASTVLDCTSWPPRILRSGVLRETDVLGIIQACEM